MQQIILLNKKSYSKISKYRNKVPHKHLKEGKYAQKQLLDRITTN